MENISDPVTALVEHLEGCIGASMAVSDSSRPRDHESDQHTCADDGHCVSSKPYPIRHASAHLSVPCDGDCRVRDVCSIAKDLDLVLRINRLPDVGNLQGPELTHCRAGDAGGTRIRLRF